jgi:hypothetical protein
LTGHSISEDRCELLRVVGSGNEQGIGFRCFSLLAKELRDFQALVSRVTGNIAPSIDFTDHRLPSRIRKSNLARATRTRGPIVARAPLVMIRRLRQTLSYLRQRVDFVVCTSGLLIVRCMGLVMRLRFVRGRLMRWFFGRGLLGSSWLRWFFCMSGLRRRLMRWFFGRGLLGSSWLRWFFCMSGLGRRLMSWLFGRELPQTLSP